MPTGPKRVAVLVLACASAPFDEMIRAIRRTWGARRVSGVEVFYVYGNVAAGGPTAELASHIGEDPPVVPAGEVRRIGDVLIAGCADRIADQEDCLLRKRLIAFDHLASSDDFDLIYTVCAASYVDPVELVRNSTHLPATRVVSGSISIDPGGRAPFVSGASMRLSVDVARELGAHRDEIISGNEFGFRDDVAIGHWIASRMSAVPLADFVDDARAVRPMTRDHVLDRSAATTVDYVVKPDEEHRPVPGAFHYHFHSRRPDAMVRFHERHFDPRRHTTRPRLRASRIRYMQIFGERCSGTRYLNSLVRKNFAGVEMTSAFGGKHWFIAGHEPRGRPNRSTDHECVRPLDDSADTLFLVIRRNPFDWLRSLHAKPYHAPGHWNLSFSEFLRKPWLCSESTRVNPIWPESETGEYFIEEAANVVSLRTLKAVHFANLESVVENVAFVGYERLAADHAGVLTAIADRFGLDLLHPDPVDDTVHHGGGDRKQYTGPTHRGPISADDLDFIRRGLDWEVEAAMGYGWGDLH
jgi:hypothetical protein